MKLGTSSFSDSVPNHSSGRGLLRTAAGHEANIVNELFLTIGYESLRSNLNSPSSQILLSLVRVQRGWSAEPRRGKRTQPRVSTLIFIHKSISAAKLLYRKAVRDHSPGLIGLGFCQKEFALKGRPNAMVFRHGSQGIHFHRFPSVAPSASGRISMELSQAFVSV
jgi:hypothetical protein